MDTREREKMPDFPPAAAAELEGDYSDWTIYDSFDDTEQYPGVIWENAAIFNEAETLILLMDENVAKKYTIATKTLGSSQFNPGVLSGVGFAQAYARSVLGTYVVWLNDPQTELYIVKNGDLIKTLTCADLGLDAGWVNSPNISPSGKYIAVSGRRTATGNMGWVVLVGS